MTWPTDKPKAARAIVEFLHDRDRPIDRSLLDRRLSVIGDVNAVGAEIIDIADELVEEGLLETVEIDTPFVAYDVTQQGIEAMDG